MKFEELQLPAELLSYLKKKGFTDLYPPQEQAVRAGLLQGKSLIVSAPTAAGKTLIAILAAFHRAKEGRKVVYLAPLRALASEKYHEFSELSEFGIRTAISTGDYDSSGESLGKADIIVLTNERFDSIVRQRVGWLSSVGLFIPDEVHLAGNDSRGPTLEMILTKVRYLGLDAQILALSATISNVKVLAEWLNSEPVESDWRPVPLRQGVYDYSRVVFTDGEERPVPRSSYGAPLDTAMETLRGGGQALVFANTRRRAVSLATKGAELTERFLSEPEKKAVAEAARRILSSGEETSLSKLLAEIVARGSAFHHAGLDSEHRRVVEEYYRAKAIKVLAATPTLCLPAGEEVIGNPDPRQIQDLTAGERVLTHGGIYESVIGPTSRTYDGPLLRVTPWFQLPMRMTPEHKVLRVTRRRRLVHSKTGNRRWWTYSEPEWTEARNLKQGDMVVFPRISDQVDLRDLPLPEIGPLANQTGKVGKHWSRLNVEQIELTPRNLEQFGMYVAEGFSEPQGQVHFAFGTYENSLTSLTVEWFKSLGLTPRIKDSTRHRRTVYACSKQVAHLVRQKFGTGAPGKRIPHEFLLLPNSKLAHFIRGMWRGDGSLTKTGPKSAKYDTTSGTLAKQLFVALVKMGYMPCLKLDRRAGERSGNKLSITHRHDLYTVSISGKQYHMFAEEVLLQPRRIEHLNRESNRGHIDDRFYYMPVRKIEVERYSGTVHNLEVEGHSSYVGSFVVHNSAGVNLPARRVVIADMARYDVETGGNVEISVLEYRQMAGRAGRPQYDDFGETVIIPPPSRPAKDILQHYANEPPEPIRSRLADESAMRSHTLATVATASGMSKMDIDGLFRKTLLAKQIGEDEVGKLTDRALGYLLGERLVTAQGNLFFATDFGRRVSLLYVDPATGVAFRDSLRGTGEGASHTVGLLQIVAGCPDFEPKFPLRSKDFELAMAFLEDHSKELLQRPSSKSFAEYDETLQDMRSVMALHGWIDEWREEQLLSRLGVEPGDMHRAVDNADWLLHSFAEIAKLFKRADLAKEVEVLRRRVASGVSAELVELTTLQGVGRVRARALYTAGFGTLEDLKEAPAEKIASVEKVGTAVARRIKEQVSRF